MKNLNNVVAWAAALGFGLAHVALSYIPAFASVGVQPGNGGKLLPSGPLSVRGNQIVDSKGNNVRIASVGWDGGQDVNGAPIGLWSVNYKVTMNAIVADGFNCVRMSWNNAGLHSTAVCRVIDYKQNPDLVGLNQMQVLDRIIAYAGKIGLKVILDHHTDEGLPPDESQQSNGLWYDVGPGADGTDGSGNPGTVTAKAFQDDWVQVAKRYKHSSAVIGYDLDNEPFVIDGAKANGENWGEGGPGDIWAMYTNVGNAIHEVDPRALIICEGPMRNTKYDSPTWRMMDLTHVPLKPVMLKIPNKVVYSVHEYPKEVSDVPDDSGPAYISRMNADWGFLETQNIAPVWIGEMGASVTVSDTDGNAWISTLLPYINGHDSDQGGPSFTGSDQPISTDWWFWGTYNVGDGWGTLSSWVPEVYVLRQQAITNQLLWTDKPL